MRTKFHRIPDVSALKNRRILFAALNWGMGHVGRSIPLLKRLTDQGNCIIVACNSHQEAIYRNYFNDLIYKPLGDYPFIFNHRGFRSHDFIKSIPSLFQQHRHEKKYVEEIVHEENIDIILSDHRYGFRHPRVESIFITHQCHLPVPWYGFIIQAMHRYLMHRFQGCWIVDSETERWAGKLSKKPNIPSKYLGGLSRFNNPSKAKKGTVLVLNGPKEFHPLLIQHFQQEIPTVDCVIGTHSLIPEGIPQITDWVEADELLMNAKTVISFCGYSTLLDFEALKCEWRCIPTPGQFEQHYLFQQKTLREGGFEKK